MRLAEHSLVRRVPGTGRFAMYDAIRAFASAQLDIPDARRLWSDALLDLSEPLCPRAVGGPRPAALRAEEDNLHQAWRWAVEDQDGTRAVRLAAVLGHLLRPTGRAQQLRALLDRTLALVPEAHGLRALRALSSASTGAYAEAEADLAVLDEANPAVRGTALEARCALARLAGDLSRAQGFMEEAVALHRSRGMRLEEGRALGLLGTVHWEQGDSIRGEALLREALAMHRLHGDTYAEAVRLGNLSTISIDAGRLGDAEELARAAFELHRQAGHRSKAALQLAALAGVALRTGRPTDAVRAYREAHRALVRAGDAAHAAVVAGNLGLALLDLGATEEARQHLELALAGHRACSDRRFEAHALGNLGHIQLHADQLVEAARSYREALRLGREAGYAHGVADVTGMEAVRAWFEGGPCDAEALRAAMAQAAALDAPRMEGLLGLVLAIVEGEPAWTRATGALHRSADPDADGLVAVARGEERPELCARSADARLLQRCVARSGIRSGR